MKYCLPLLFLLSFSFVTRAEMVDRIIAVVNDEAVTQSDADQFRKKLKSGGLLDEALLAMYDRKKLETDEKSLIEYLVDERTIDSEIKRQGIVTPVEQVETEISNIVKSKGIDRNQLKMALKNEGVAYSDYQDFMKTSLQRQTILQKEVSSKIKISDDEINAFYANQKKTGNPLVFEYTLSHIFFANTNGGPAAAEERAKQVRAKLDQGLPFETLVSQYSEDKQFSQSGSFGTFRLTDFNHEVGNVMAKLSNGDTSPVVKMPDGFHIFKVNKKALVPSPDLEAKREEIRRYLTNENFKRQYRAWVDQKRAESFIHIQNESVAKQN